MICSVVTEFRLDNLFYLGALPENVSGGKAPVPPVTTPLIMIAISGCNNTSGLITFQETQKVKMLFGFRPILMVEIASQNIQKTAKKHEFDQCWKIFVEILKAYTFSRFSEGGDSKNIFVKFLASEVQSFHLRFFL